MPFYKICSREGLLETVRVPGKQRSVDSKSPPMQPYAAPVEFALSCNCLMHMLLIINDLYSIDKSTYRFCQSRNPLRDPEFLFSTSTFQSHQSSAVVFLLILLRPHPTRRPRRYFSLLSAHSQEYSQVLVRPKWPLWLGQNGPYDPTRMDDSIGTN